MHHHKGTTRKEPHSWHGPFLNANNQTFSFTPSYPHHTDSPSLTAQLDFSHAISSPHVRPENVVCPPASKEACFPSLPGPCKVVAHDLVPGQTPRLVWRAVGLLAAGRAAGRGKRGQGRLGAEGSGLCVGQGGGHCIRGHSTVWG